MGSQPLPGTILNPTSSRGGRLLATVLLSTVCACDILPQKGDTEGEQQQAQWFTSARVVVDTDPQLTVIRLRADSAADGHHVLLARFEFNPGPALGDEYALSVALDLGDAHELRRATPYALGAAAARIPTYATVTCLCRPLRSDSVQGTFTLSHRGIAQIYGRIDPTLFFTAWDDTARHASYRLRQRIDGLR